MLISKLLPMLTTSPSAVSADAAATKPFGFMPFYPGPGLGGHCIPIDPFYLTWKAREVGRPTRFIELAGEINTAMPEYVVQRLLLALNERGRSLRGSRVLVLGVACVGVVVEAFAPRAARFKNAKENWSGFYRQKALEETDQEDSGPFGRSPGD